MARERTCSLKDRFLPRHAAPAAPRFPPRSPLPHVGKLVNRGRCLLILHKPHQRGNATSWQAPRNHGKTTRCRLEARGRAARLSDMLLIRRFEEKASTRPREHNMDIPDHSSFSALNISYDFQFLRNITAYIYRLFY